MYNICIIWPVFLLVSAVFFNEFLIYYLKIGATCGWPEIRNEREQPLRAFMIADTHLLGIYKGHWLDKLKREWQMKRGFHTAVSVLSPEVVFFLGDLLDEGKWSTREMFNGYSEEFRRLFATHVPTYAVAGNHDVGFHYEFLPQGIDWFRENFNRSLVDSVSIREIHFVLVNSMAFHGDGCLLCRRAEEELDKVSKMLDCARKQDCNGTDTFSPYSRPILLLHFPLFRKDESDCLRDSEFDYSAPKRDEEYRPKWESLSEEATRELIKKLSPRAVFNGHSHRDCKKRWTRPQNFWEYTVNSFSWRNGDRPAFLLVQITRNEISVSTCFLPNESTTIVIYVVCGTILLIWLLSHITTCLSCRKRARTTSFPLLPQTKEDKSD